MRTIHFSYNFSSSIKTVGVTVLGGLWALEWAWHSAETNLRCLRSSGICTPKLSSLVSEISAFIRTDRRTWLDRLASDPVQEYIYFMGSETLPSACYILSDESSIPFYSTSSVYKNNESKISVCVCIYAFIADGRNEIRLDTNSL